MTLPIGVLVSGSGSNLQSLIDKIEEGVLDARIRVVVANRKDAYGLERARKHSIRAEFIDHTAFDGREGFDAELVRVLREAGCEAVIMAGFMRLVTSVLLDAFPEKVLNIHPALLPSFPGAHGQKDAADYGVKLSGCTVHFVNEKMDNGPIVIQAAVPAMPEDDGSSLGGRILELEHRIFPQAVQWLATGRLRVQGRKVLVAPADLAPARGDGRSLVNPPLEEGF